MPCILALLVLFFPRIGIAVLYLFTNFFQGVFDTILWPLIGFLLLPLTLLAYTWMTKYQQTTDTVFLVVMIIAVVLDLGLIGGGEASRRSR
ncbi:MAG: hypothetical protein ACRD7E_19965 [Bryobacteraceae bacterium]